MPPASPIPRDEGKIIDTMARGKASRMDNENTFGRDDD
jgi:hypothetical protein